MRAHPESLTGGTCRDLPLLLSAVFAVAACATPIGEAPARGSSSSRLREAASTNNSASWRRSSSIASASWASRAGANRPRRSRPVSFAKTS